MGKNETQLTISILTPHRKQAMTSRGLCFCTILEVVFLYQPTVKQSCLFAAMSNRLHFVYTMVFPVKVVSGVKLNSALYSVTVRSLLKLFAYMYSLKVVPMCPMI